MRRFAATALLLALFANCDSANNQHPSTKYEEKKTSLQEMERDSPLKFLKVTAHHRSNLVQKEVIEGEIANKATMASYKNIELRITFLDNEGSVIEKQKHILDETIGPNSTINFKIKTGHVKGASSVAADITNAVADK